MIVDTYVGRKLIQDFLLNNPIILTQVVIILVAVIIYHVLKKEN